MDSSQFTVRSDARTARLQHLTSNIDHTAHDPRLAVRGSIHWHSMDRHLTVSGFVVERDRTLLHWHRKNGMWLPPGGHIEPDEDPVQAVVREVLEETGITAEVIPARAPMPFDAPAQLPPPYTILVEDIDEGPHQHIDLIYFLRPVAGAERVLVDDDPFVWVTTDQLRRGDPLPVAACGLDLPIPEDVRLLALEALRSVHSE